MPEDTADRLLLEMEEAQLPTQSPVIPLFRLLQHVEVSFELLVVRPRGAIDPLKLRPVAVTPPIGTRQRHQLEGVTGILRRRHVGAAAQIQEPALTVEADRLPSGIASVSSTLKGSWVFL